MKKLIFISLLLISLVSCKPDKTAYLNCTWEIEVTYLNGDMETLTLERDSVYKGGDLHLYDSNVVMCTPFRNEQLLCGVRKMNVLSETKIKTYQ